VGQAPSTHVRTPTTKRREELEDENRLLHKIVALLLD
jgi:hypothetical protein